MFTNKIALTVETAVFDWICYFSSIRDRKVQSYLVEYCLESVEEYSEGKIHEGEPEPRNGNVNTVYFINQAKELKYSNVARSEIARDCKCLLIFELPAQNNVRIIKYTFTN